MNIAVIGSEYPGLVTACSLACSGHWVIMLEEDLDRLEKLHWGTLTEHISVLDFIFQAVTENGKLTFTHDPMEALNQASFIIITTGTPLRPAPVPSCFLGLLSALPKV